MAYVAEKLLEEIERPGESWRETVLAMYDEGASDREIMRELNLTPAKWDVLYKDITASDFNEVIELGRMLQHAWWETQGRTNLKNKQFNSALWTINMKNRFGWSEKSEQSMTNIDLGNLDDDSLKREVAVLLKRLDEGRGQT